MPTATRKSVKKRPVAVKRKAASVKTPVRKRPTIKKVAVPKVRTFGEVIHYYDKINVAIIEVKVPFGLGELVLVRHGTLEYVQPVTSLQIDHLPVSKTKKGDIVGMRVMHKTPEGAQILPV